MLFDARLPPFMGLTSAPMVPPPITMMPSASALSPVPLAPVVLTPALTLLAPTVFYSHGTEGHGNCWARHQHPGNPRRHETSLGAEGKEQPLFPGLSSSPEEAVPGTSVAPALEDKKFLQ